MRLFLSSYQFGNHADELVQLVEDKTVLYIGNAKDDYDVEERQQKITESRSEFEKLGFSFTEVDLRQYVTIHEGLRELAEHSGLIWCGGGNTFLLRRALYDSGMDVIIKDLVLKNHLVYGGSSAGAIIATPSLRGTENGDDPEAVQRVYGRETIWDGLDLIKLHIVPHYQSDWFANEAKAMKRYLDMHNMPNEALTDGQVYVVNGDKETLLS